MRRLLLVVPLFLAVVAGALVAPAGPAHACSCAMLGTAQQVEGADVIVRGTVTGSDDPGGGGSNRLVTYDVTVAEVYKGTAVAKTSVRSPAAGGSCGIGVQPGREYVVFANRVGKDLRAGLCGGTTAASPALVAEVERITGPGTALPRATLSSTSDAPRTSAASPASPGPEPSSTLPVGLGLGGALAVAGLAVLWWRRRAA